MTDSDFTRSGQLGQPDRPGDADSDRSAALLDLIRPVASIALTCGAKLPELVELLKVALAEAAQARAPGSRWSESKAAVMTGVHRKDLRRMRVGGERRRPRRSIAAEVFSRWLADPQFLTKRGSPRLLTRADDGTGGPSFESLVAGISKDVHPRAVLEELLRLGHVELDRQQRVKLVATAFVPDRDRSESLRFAAANAADHLAAIDANLSRAQRRFLEQAVYADELSERSAVEFNRNTAGAWEQMFATMMPQLRELFERDRREGQPLTHRVRLGMYGYMTTLPPPSAAPDSADAKIEANR